jgi:hypothetical protein
MKPFGNSKRDNLCCRRGCCASCRIHERNHKTPEAIVRASRKRGRAEAKNEIRQEM